MRIALYTGASAGDDPRWSKYATDLVRFLVGKGHSIVYGGGSKGLMGVVADVALAHGGHVTGVIPQRLVDAETAHRGLSRLEVVETMTQRKDRMAELADAMVALPGGVGTLEEFFDVWSEQMLAIRVKPIALYSPEGYWDLLVQLLDTMTERGFVYRPGRDALIVEDDPAALLRSIEGWQAPPSRW